MDKDLPTNIIPSEDPDPRENKGELLEPPQADKDSGQGTASNGKSSSSASQASDATSGVEEKSDPTGQDPPVLDPQLGTPTNGATGSQPDGTSRQPKTPKKSPIHKGLSWVKKTLSPKKSRDRSVSPKAGGSRNLSPGPKSPKKSPFKKASLRKRYMSPSNNESQPFLQGDDSRRESSASSVDGHSRDKSPGGPKSPKKSPFRKPSFRSKLRSSKKEKHLSGSESEPFLPGDEGRRERSSSPKAGCSHGGLPGSPKKSPSKIPVKASFRLRITSSSKKDERADESQPFIQEDECRNSFSDENRSVERAQASQRGAIPKTRSCRPQKGGKIQSPAVTKAPARITRSMIPYMNKASLLRREKIKEKYGKKFAKQRVSPAQTPMDEYEQYEMYPKLPEKKSDRQSGRWCEMRCATDTEYTGSPSEVDLDSMSSYRLSSDPAESRAGSAMSFRHLDIADVRRPSSSLSSAAEDLARRLELTSPEEQQRLQTGEPSGGERSEAEQEDKMHDSDENL